MSMAPHITVWRQIFKDVLISATLANLILFRVWSYLLDLGESSFLAETPENPTDYIAIMINTGAIMIMLFVGAQCVRRGTSRWPLELATIAMFACLLPFLDVVRRSLGFYTDRLWFVGGFWLPLGALVMTLGIIWFRVHIRRILYFVLLLLSPISAITLIQAAWITTRGMEQKPQATSSPFTSVLNTSSRHRVVWVIFDEWDQRVTFDQRPAGLRLPNIDAFARNSVVATNAYPPSGATQLSLPSLMTGQYLKMVEFGGPDRLLIQAVGSSGLVDFRAIPNVLTKAAAAGMRVAIVGWCLPYARIFPDTSHFWVRWGAAPRAQMFRANQVSSAMLAQLRFVFAPQTGRQEAVNLYARLHEAARQAVSSSAVDIAFLHYPIPHSPSVYDMERRVLSDHGSLEASDFYVNNLALVDRTLGELLADLDAANLRDSTTVVLSSDHWWRTADVLDGQIDHRIPLMIQIGGDRRARVCNARINTVSVTSIINDILSGAVTDNDAVLARMQSIEVKEPFRYASGGMKQLLNAPVELVAPGTKK